MIGVMQDKPYRSAEVKNSRKHLHAFVLVEVLLSLTILAIAGIMIMRSFVNAMDATQAIRDLSKVVFLTEGKMHELTMIYDRKAIENAQLGEFGGRYTQPGAEAFLWNARVETDKDNTLYIISVWTSDAKEAKPRRRVRRSRRDEYMGFMLKTIVPAARYNDTLVFGGSASQRPSRRSSGMGDSRGDRRSR